uniref:Uncharacterized protein n=1 Tax=Roseihalotalea indica TaxID=2867963 RepID=A0AA49GRH5_9BACT|nr:hypothetical protein K4G66_32065 [Tunicatimonas sp. TK19036]
MIPIPQEIRMKLVEIDQKLHLLSRQLYGKKLIGEYESNGRFQNFILELHLDGAFTLHFPKRILGTIEQKVFDQPEASQVDVISELNLLMAVIENQLHRVQI